MRARLLLFNHHVKRFNSIYTFWSRRSVLWTACFLWQKTAGICRTYTRQSLR